MGVGIAPERSSSLTSSPSLANRASSARPASTCCSTSVTALIGLSWSRSASAVVASSRVEVDKAVREAVRWGLPGSEPAGSSASEPPRRRAAIRLRAASTCAKQPSA